MKRSSVPQSQDKRKAISSEIYFPDTSQRVYEENRKKSIYHKLNKLEEAHQELSYFLHYD